MVLSNVNVTLELPNPLAVSLKDCISLVVFSTPWLIKTAVKLSKDPDANAHLATVTHPTVFKPVLVPGIPPEASWWTSSPSSGDSALPEVDGSCNRPGPPPSTDIIPAIAWSTLVFTHTKHAGSTSLPKINALWSIYSARLVSAGFLDKESMPPCAMNIRSIRFDRLSRAAVHMNAVSSDGKPQIRLIDRINILKVVATEHIWRPLPSSTHWPCISLRTGKWATPDKTFVLLRAPYLPRIFKNSWMSSRTCQPCPCLLKKKAIFVSQSMLNRPAKAACAPPSDSVRLSSHTAADLILRR